MVLFEFLEQRSRAYSCCAAGEQIAAADLLARGDTRDYPASFALKRTLCLPSRLKRAAEPTIRRRPNCGAPFDPAGAAAGGLAGDGDQVGGDLPLFELGDRLGEPEGARCAPGTRA